MLAGAAAYAIYLSMRASEPGMSCVPWRWSVKRRAFSTTAIYSPSVARKLRRAEMYSSKLRSCATCTERGWPVRSSSPGPLVSTSYCLVLMMALLLAPKSGQAFIYFQF